MISRPFPCTAVAAVFGLGTHSQTLALAFAAICQWGHQGVTHRVDSVAFTAFMLLKKKMLRPNKWRRVEQVPTLLLRSLSVRGIQPQRAQGEGCEDIEEE
jgi:hypothetical protein